MKLKQLDEILARTKQIQDEWHGRVLLDRGEVTECRRNSVEELAGFVNQLTAALTQDRAEHNKALRVSHEASEQWRSNYKTMENERDRIKSAFDDLRIEIARLRANPRDSRKVEAQKAEIKRLTEVIEEERRMVALNRSERDHWRDRCLKEESGRNRELESRKNKAEARVGELEAENAQIRKMHGEESAKRVDLQRRNYTQVETIRQLMGKKLGGDFRKEYDEASAERYRLSNRVDALLTEIQRRDVAIEDLRVRVGGLVKDLTTANAVITKHSARIAELTKAEERISASPFRQSVLDKLRNDVLTATKGPETMAAVQAMLAFVREEKPQAEAKADPVKRTITVSVAADRDPYVFDAKLFAGGTSWKMSKAERGERFSLFEFTSP